MHIFQYASGGMGYLDPATEVALPRVRVDSSHLGLDVNGYALILFDFSFCSDTFTFVPLYSFCQLSCFHSTFLSYCCSLAPSLRVKLGEGVPHF